MTGDGPKHWEFTSWKGQVRFAVFVFLLIRDLLPGEPVDVGALLFGMAMFVVFCWTDFYWSPWKSRG